MKRVYEYIMLVSIVLVFTSCKKYLDKKPNIALNIPTSLDDFQQLLDYESTTYNSAPGITDLGCDDYYFADSNAFASYGMNIRNAHIWKSDIWEGLPSNDWNDPYRVIYLSNVVLEGLKDIKPQNPLEVNKYNSIYGQALFVRGIEHYFLEECFGQPYKPPTANLDLGIPLKLTADLSKIAVRSKVKDVFIQIIRDLKASSQLVPSVTNTKNRPSKAAAFAMLSRVYLTMQDYENARIYADSSLSINSTLTDYNSIPLTSNNPFAAFAAPNDGSFEVLYPTFQETYGVLIRTNVYADSGLYKLYNINDLRKDAFFRASSNDATHPYKATYSGSPSLPFGGPAVDEMYLTRAECYARGGNKDAALNDLNTLMIKRWRNNGTWTPFVAADAEAALRLILVERRKELVTRGIRWADLRRLNQDSRFALTLTRKVGSLLFNLPPNDIKYTYPIPDNEIRLSGIEQNPR